MSSTLENNAAHDAASDGVVGVQAPIIPDATSQAPVPNAICNETRVLSEVINQEATPNTNNTALRQVSCGPDTSASAISSITTTPIRRLVIPQPVQEEAEVASVSTASLDVSIENVPYKMMDDGSMSSVPRMPSLRSFKNINENNDYEDGYDSDGEIGPFFNAVVVRMLWTKLMLKIRLMRHLHKKKLQLQMKLKL